MDEGRPPDLAIGPEPAPQEPAPDASAPFEPVPAEAATESVESVESVEPVDVEPIQPRPPSRRMVALVIVLIVAFVSFAVVGGRIVLGGPAAASPSAPRIAFTDAAGALHTANAEGTQVTDYPLKGVEFGFPTWSPDGTRIAVTGDGAGTSAAYVVDTTDPSAKPKAVYESADVPPFYLYWSPDGRQIAFLAQEADKIALDVVPADGSARPTTLREGAPLYWDWVGSDHAVAHVGLSGAGSFLGEVALDGKNAEQEKLSAGDFRSPAVSRDGAYRAYVTSGKNASGVVTLEAADRSKRQTASVFGPAAVSFDPAGTTLAYVAAQHPLTNDPGFPLGPLKVMDPATGQTRTLLDGEVLAFFWSPDGKTIAALTLKPAGNEVVDLPGAHLASIGADPAALAYVPLTLSFVDVASGSVRAHRPFAVASKFVNGILPYFDQYALSHHVWKPDSTAIALPGFATAGDQLYSIPANGGEPTPIEGAAFGFWSP
jgi:TolB protein